MLTIKGGKKILTTPVSAEDLKDIHIGDVVYLNGDLTTCRDVAHRRLVEEGRPLPVDVKDAAIFHAGPIIRPLENDKFEMVSVGPTTSMRMEKFEYEFVQKSGVRVIVGKGGMERGTEYALEQIYNIVDNRYLSRKPLIVTTNLTLDEIRHPQDTAHARIYDRLLEMCVPISCIGVSFRKETAQEKLERMKLLIG